MLADVRPQVPPARLSGRRPARAPGRRARRSRSSRATRACPATRACRTCRDSATCSDARAAATSSRCQSARSPRASKCGADLHACVQCASFDGGRDVRVHAGRFRARVSPKDARNTCTFFSPRDQGGTRDRIDSCGAGQRRQEGVRRPVQVLRRSKSAARRIAATIRPVPAPSARCEKQMSRLSRGADARDVDRLERARRPARSWSAFAAHMSSRQWPGAVRGEPAVRTAARRRANASRTARVDLIAARTDARADRGHEVRGRHAQRGRSSATVAAAMPAAVPRQPACTAATTRRLRSAIRIGTQSATRTLIAPRRIGRDDRVRLGTDRRSRVQAPPGGQRAAVHLADAHDVTARTPEARCPPDRSRRRPSRPETASWPRREQVRGNRRRAC